MRISSNIAIVGIQINPQKNLLYICLDQTEWGMRRSLTLKTQLLFKDVSLRVQQLKVITSKILLRLHQPSLECNFLVLEFHKYYISFAFARKNIIILAAKLQWHSVVASINSQGPYSKLTRIHQKQSISNHFHPIAFLFWLLWSFLPCPSGRSIVLTLFLRSLQISLLHSFFPRLPARTKNRNVVMKSKNLLDIRALIYIHAFSEIS